MTALIYIAIAITTVTLLIGALVGAWRLFKVWDDMGERDFVPVQWVSKKNN